MPTSALYRTANPRLILAFSLFGLLNNLPYILFLSSALDLLGPIIPKALLLLFDVVPGFVAKLVLPYVIHRIPYAIRVVMLSLIATSGMLLVASSPSDTEQVGVKLLGVGFASLASGAGELTFLGLTHFYGRLALLGWAMGTGAAGLVGAAAYAVMTTSVGWSGRGVIGGGAVLSVGLAGTYFGLLPRRPLGKEEVFFEEGIEEVDGLEERSGLLGQISRPVGVHEELSWRRSLKRNLRRSRRLFFPYMLPLLLVYVAEYSINQGVSPTLLFPLEQTPFKHYRAFYPTYNAIYQSGVFISRSSILFVRLHNLYLPSWLQVLNLVVLILQALFNFIPSVWMIFAMIFWEGLLGGAVYVNTFAEISEMVREEEREFSLGAVTVSDSAGICIAGFLGMALEVALCGYQVRNGRDWCRQI